MTVSIDQEASGPERERRVIEFDERAFVVRQSAAGDLQYMLTHIPEDPAAPEMVSATVADYVAELGQDMDDWSLLAEVFDDEYGALWARTDAAREVTR